MKVQRLAIALLAAATALGGISAAHAGQKIDANAPIGAQIVKLLSDLNLTEEQKEQAAGVIAARRDGNRTMIRDLLKARQNLFETIHDGTYDEDAIRSAYQDVSRIEEDLAVRRAKVAAELKSILTDEQRDMLVKAKKAAFKQINKRVDYAFAAVDCWVDSRLSR